MILRDYDQYRDFRPRQDFPKQADEHRNDAHAKCRYVQCPYMYPDYSVLTEEMRNYYLFWRSSLLGGECRETDISYVHLFLNESMVLGRDPAVIMESMRLIHLADCIPAYSVADLVVDLCITYRLPYPEWLETFPFKEDGLMLAYYLATPTVYLPKPMLRLHYPREYWPSDYKLFDVALNCCLHEIDLYLADRGGSLLGEYAEGMAREVHQVFPNFCLPGKLRVTFEYPKLGERFSGFIQGLIARCDADFELEGHLRQRADFPQEYRGIVKSLSERPERLAVWHSPDRPLFFRDFRDEDMDGTVHRLEDYHHQAISPKFRTDMADNRGIENPEPAPYVPSECFHPMYRDMRQEQRDFYYHWRTCVRRGRYPETDVGYLWLYVCEEINSEDDPPAVYRRLFDLMQAYEPGNFSPPGFFMTSLSTLRRAVLDYAIFYLVPLSSPLVCNTVLGETLLFEAFLEGRTGPLGKEVFRDMAKLRANQVGRIDDDVATVASAVLLRADKQMKGGIYKVTRMGYKSVKYNIFEDVQFYGRPPKSKMPVYSVPLFFVDKYWREAVTTMLMTVSDCVRRHRGTAKKKPDACIFYGVDITPIAEEETAAHFSRGYEMAMDPASTVRGTATLDRFCRRTAAREVELDSGKIDRAQDDLDFVSSRLAVDEEEERAPAPEPEAPAKAHGSGWEDLGRSLSPSQREYLQALADGEDVSAILKRSRRSPGKMDDSINQLALDLVGDTVIEEGSLVKEYRQDITELLRGH